jgi:hypothetical protein
MSSSPSHNLLTAQQASLKARREREEMREKGREESAFHSEMKKWGEFWGWIGER